MRVDSDVTGINYTEAEIKIWLTDKYKNKHKMYVGK